MEDLNPVLGLTMPVVRSRFMAISAWSEVGGVFCIRCGAKNLDNAKFCYVCGKETVTTAQAIPEEPRQLLPYRWGKFQGWVWLGVGSLVVLLAIWSIATGQRLNWDAREFVVLSPLLILSGYAFAWRKKYAVILTYVWIGLSVVVAAVPAFVSLGDSALSNQQIAQNVAEDFGRLLGGVLFWGLCCRYYRRRRSEFS